MSLFRVLAMWLMLPSMLSAGERPHFVVTVPPRFVANTCKPKTAPAPIDYRCVKIAGVDHDLDAILKEYRREWTWPGMTEQSLRNHLREHQIANYDGLTFNELKKLHAALHEREAAKPAQVAVPVASPCPGGVCPNPGYAPTRRWRLFR